MELIITLSPPHRRARPASGLYTGFSVLLAPPTPTLGCSWQGLCAPCVSTPSTRPSSRQGLGERMSASGSVRVNGRWAAGPEPCPTPPPPGIIEIRSIRVGVVVLKAVHTGFYVAMNRRGRLYGSVSAA